MLRFSVFAKFGLQSTISVGRVDLLNCRLLYSSNYLGIDSFIETHKQLNAQFGEMRGKFMNRMKSLLENGEENSLSNVVFSEDLKNSAYLAKSDEDFDLLQKLIKKYSSQSKGIRFSSFVFGPVVLRLCHILNKPAEALSFVQSEEYGDFFQQLKTYTLTANLLFKNEKYREIIDLYKCFKTYSPLKDSFPRFFTVYIFGACYKLNTVESFKFAVDLFSELRKSEAPVLRRSIAFISALALQQNDPIFALEVLSLMTTSHSFVTIRNLRIRALCQVGRLDDAIMILRACLNDDRPTRLKREEISILSETLSVVKEAVDRRNDKETSAEFSQINRALREHEFVMEKTFDEVILAPEEPEIHLNDMLNGDFSQRGPQKRFQNSRDHNSKNFRGRQGFRERQGILAQSE